MLPYNSFGVFGAIGLWFVRFKSDSSRLCVLVCTCARVRVCVFVHICACIYIHTCIRIHTCIHTCINTFVSCRFVQFKLDSYTLVNYRAKPVRPFDAGDSGVYFAFFYGLTFMIFLAWSYYLWFIQVSVVWMCVRACVISAAIWRELCIVPVYLATVTGASTSSNTGVSVPPNLSRVFVSIQTLTKVSGSHPGPCQSGPSLLRLAPPDRRLAGQRDQCHLPSRRRARFHA